MTETTFSMTNAMFDLGRALHSWFGNTTALITQYCDHFHIDFIHDDEHIVKVVIYVTENKWSVKTKERFLILDNNQDFYLYMMMIKHEHTTH